MGFSSSVHRGLCFGLKRTGGRDARGTGGRSIIRTILQVAGPVVLASVTLQIAKARLRNQKNALRNDSHDLAGLAAPGASWTEAGLAPKTPLGMAPAKPVIDSRHLAITAVPLPTIKFL